MTITTDANNVSSIEGMAASLSTLYREFGVARETIRKRFEEAGVQPSGTRSGHPVYRLRDAVPAIFLLHKRGGEGDIDPKQLPPKDRLDYYRSERERLKLEEEQGKLVPVAEMRDELAAAVKLMVQALDTLPDVLERDCALEPQVITRIEEGIRGVREELAQELGAG